MDMIGDFIETFSIKENTCWIWNVRLRLHRSKKPSCLMCAETNPDFKVKVLDAVLKVRKVHIS